MSYYLGIFEGHVDPAVCLVKDGHVIAFAEEERFLRFKHAARIFPARALQYCLKQAGITAADISAIALPWNSPAFADGRMQAFYDDLKKQYPVDARTLQWQNFTLTYFHPDKIRERLTLQWRKLFADIPLPPLRCLPHHEVHASQAFSQSGFNKALCITVDGSGDQHCTVLWHGEGNSIRPIREICIPHSLGWYYAAFTEYLGFEAYDGEYKVMGLAAYGRPNEVLRGCIEKILQAAPDSIEYRLDPSFIHYGPHSYSERYTDKLVELLGRPPRLASEKIEKWHEDLAFAVQEGLETAVTRLIRWGLKEVSTQNVCISGGVAHNVKMNSRIFLMAGVTDVFAHPLCNDSGAAMGASLHACFTDTHQKSEPLRSLALGPEFGDDEIETALKSCGIRYEKCVDIAETTARELANGKVVGWFQGRMEAGPRALGQRSILADPRSIDSRDRVNAIIKFREYWRPFCPSLLYEAAPRYLKKWVDAPFMIIAFEASDALQKDAPAIVHVDGTARVQLVKHETHPLYHKLIADFGALSGVPVLLNTSFNVKGEPVVCTIHDALRTFFATGMECLSIGSFLLHKGQL